MTESEKNEFYRLVGFNKPNKNEDLLKDLGPLGDIFKSFNESEKNGKSD